MNKMIFGIQTRAGGVSARPVEKIGLFIFIICFGTILSGFVSLAFAVPETTDVTITDVSTSSFSAVWMTDVPADPTVEVYSDSAMVNRISENLTITSMPAGRSEIVQSAKNKGIMKVSVSGLDPASKYYVRTVTKNPLNESEIGYSSLYEVVTESEVSLYYIVDGTARDSSNDLSSFRVYIRPSDTEAEPGLGDLIVLQSDNARYPISAFAGDWIGSPEGILDLNNLFGADHSSLRIAGGERITLKVYRGGGLSTLTHYRRVPQNLGMCSVVEPVKGFFADINLDGRVDDDDFTEFKKQYRTLPDDFTYNPDFDFVEDDEGRVDAREFSKFSREYGRTDVQ